MLDHISLPVGDLKRSARFYDAVLEPLGYVRVFESEYAVGYAAAPQQDDVFALRRADNGFAPPQEMHIAFCARSRGAVLRFHAAALDLGAISDGDPDLHPMYGEGYFAAFVTDPDGYRIEAVVHEPIVRVRTDADIEACVAALELVHKFDGYPSSWPADPLRWLTPEGLHQAWVARIGSAIVGHIAVGEIDPIESPHFVDRSGRSGKPPLEIKRLFVVPHARGHGVAQALLAAAVAYAGEQQSRAVLEVTQDRRSAIRLYEKAGWHHIATAPAGWTRASGERPLVRHYEFAEAGAR